MKAPTLAVFVALVAVSQAAAISEDDVSSYSIIDPIIKSILEKMRSKLADLKIDDINQQINNPKLKASIIARGISIKNADTFVINNLKSTLMPLKLNNLTLTWDTINAGASYDVDAHITLPEVNVPARIYAKGDARVALKRIFFTVGANMELKNKAPQIKPRGLFGFDISIGSAKVSLSSLMGSPEFGTAVGDFISRVIPDAVNTLKKPLFDAFHDTIIEVLNQILKNYSTLFMDEMPELSFEGSDLSEEFFSFPEEVLDFKEIEPEA